MAENTKVSVPKDAGDVIVVTYPDGEVVEYKVKNGSLSVENERLGNFLGVVSGSKAGGDSVTDKGDK